MLDVFRDFGLNVLAARRRGSKPVDLDEVIGELNRPIGEASLFAMFEDESEFDSFHFVIDSIDIRADLIDEELIRVILGKINFGNQYEICWCMFEGTFMDPTSLFKGSWEIESTFAISFGGCDPIVELNDEKRKGQDWRKLMEQATHVLQSP